MASKMSCRREFHKLLKLLYHSQQVQLPAAARVEAAHENKHSQNCPTGSGYAESRSKIAEWTRCLNDGQMEHNQ